MKNIILGAGDHAHALYRLFTDSTSQFHGCVSPESSAYNLQNYCPWLGTDSTLKQMSPRNILLYNGLGSTSSTLPRQKLYTKSRDIGFQFGSLIHSTAILANDITFSQGLQVFPGVIIQPGVKISENVLINTGCIIEHDCEVGAHSHIAPGAVLSGGVKIGSNVHVGSSSVIMQGAQIGNNAIIGMGAVVLQNVPGNTMVVGNPARMLKKRT